MGFGKAIATCMGKYAVFSGRATRSEFWWFYLFAVLMHWGATLVENSIFAAFVASGEVYDYYYHLAPPWWQQGVILILFLVPVIAAGARRLHDTNRSAWWLLLAFTGIGIVVIIFWLAKDTKMEDNKYGPAPEPVTQNV